MATTDTLISKIDALASSIGNVIKTKLSKTEAATIYETKDSLKALAYKDTIAPTDLTDDTVAILKGEKGDTGASITKAELDANGHLILTIG
jgi:hypothetical protein